MYSRSVGAARSCISAAFAPNFSGTSTERFTNAASQLQQLQRAHSPLSRQYVRPSGVVSSCHYAAAAAARRLALIVAVVVNEESCIVRAAKRQTFFQSTCVHTLWKEVQVEVGVRFGDIIPASLTDLKMTRGFRISSSVTLVVPVPVPCCTPNAACANAYQRLASSRDRRVVRRRRRRRFGAGATTASGAGGTGAAVTT